MALLTWDAYRDKTLGCWMGKNAGGTLGGPVEGRKEILNRTAKEAVHAEISRKQKQALKSLGYIEN
jgi:hypothetical protein